MPPLWWHHPGQEGARPGGGRTNCSASASSAPLGRVSIISRALKNGALSPDPSPAASRDRGLHAQTCIDMTAVYPEQGFNACASAAFSHQKRHDDSTRERRRRVPFLQRTQLAAAAEGEQQSTGALQGGGAWLTGGPGRL